MNNYSKIILTAVFTIALSLSFCFASTDSYASTDSIKKEIKAKEKVVRKILKQPAKAGSKKQAAKEADLKDTINKLFDFEELGMRALEMHWDDLSKEKQQEFVSLLQQLIEKNYLLKTAKTTKYKLKWGTIVPEDEYFVLGFKIKSGKYKATIQFRILEKNSTPVVFDMLIDDVSLMENYRSQFNRIIKKDGFEKLLEKMRNRLNELEKPAKAKADDKKGEVVKPL